MKDGKSAQAAEIYDEVRKAEVPKQKKIEAIRRSMPESPTTLVMEERRPEEARTTHIHKRGEFLQPGEAVDAGVPAFLPPFPSDAPRNRLGLARCR